MRDTPRYPIRGVALPHDVNTCGANEGLYAHVVQREDIGLMTRKTQVRILPCAP